MQVTAEQKDAVRENLDQAAGRGTPEEGPTVREDLAEAVKGAHTIESYGWWMEEQMLFPEEIEEFAKSLLKSEAPHAEAGRVDGGKG